VVIAACVLGSSAWACLPGPEPKPPKPIDIVGISATPSPATPGQKTLISIKIKTAEERDELRAWVSYGDGSSDYFYGSTNWDDLQGIEHTYAAAGVYWVSVTAYTPRLSASSELALVVGRGNVCNPINGIFLSATDATGTPRYDGGITQLRMDATSVGASSGETEYEDSGGVKTTKTGFNTSHTYTKRGIYRATSTARSSGGSSLGKARKMLNISGKDVNDSAALGDPPSVDIRLKKMSGKLVFAPKTGTDKVSFSGIVKLPAGLNLAQTGGVELVAGIGNIVGTVKVDEKGKVTDVTNAGLIVKAKVKWPKTAAGVTALGDEATIDVSLAGEGLSSTGMDTDGITSAPRSDETKLKVLERLVQVDVLLAGVPYEASIPVQYKLAKVKTGATTSEAGQFKGLPSRQAAAQ
jgi:PKD repeat protein